VSGSGTSSRRQTPSGDRSCAQARWRRRPADSRPVAPLATRRKASRMAARLRSAWPAAARPASAGDGHRRARHLPSTDDRGPGATDVAAAVAGEDAWMRHRRSGRCGSRGALARGPTEPRARPTQSRRLGVGGFDRAGVASAMALGHDGNERARTITRVFVDAPPCRGVELPIEPGRCENGVIARTDVGPPPRRAAGRARAWRRCRAGRARPPGCSARAWPCRARGGAASRRPSAARAARWR
jgi:hypothetical protein